jgi:hypothetical protein
MEKEIRGEDRRGRVGQEMRRRTSVGEPWNRVKG